MSALARGRSTADAGGAAGAAVMLAGFTVPPAASLLTTAAVVTGSEHVISTSKQYCCYNSVGTTFVISDTAVLSNTSSVELKSQEPAMIALCGSAILSVSVV